MADARTWCLLVMLMEQCSSITYEGHLFPELPTVEERHRHDAKHTRPQVAAIPRLPEVEVEVVMVMVMVMSCFRGQGGEVVMEGSQVYLVKNRRSKRLGAVIGE